MHENFLGLMSGTSADGIDAVILNIGDNGMRLLGHGHHPYSENIVGMVNQLCNGEHDQLERVATLDHLLGIEFAKAANELLADLCLDAADVTAIGSHGQTVRHHPPSVSSTPFTLQLGDPNIIAEKTGITTVADFRRRDMAAGGEGAPLVPAFHCAAFAEHSEHRIIVNIGGIANISNPNDGSGFDTGPGNTLMDGWIRRHLGHPYDSGGDWAGSGNPDPELLGALLRHPYFQAPPPKSTGRELFNLAWLDDILARLDPIAPEDVQATLLEFTATSIVEAIKSSSRGCTVLYACGGGTNNLQLMNRLARLGDVPVRSTADLGIDPQHVEAAAFAWLARQTLLHLPGNRPQATGARRAVILGGIYPA